MWRPGRWRSALVGGVGLGALAFAAPAASRAEPPAGPAAPFAHGAQQVGLSVGGSIGFPLIGGDEHEVDDTRMLGVFPRWAIGVTDPLARGAFYQGNVELGVEPLALFNFRPRFGWAAGGSLLLHYNFLAMSERAIVPFVEGAAGIGHLAFDLDGESDGFIFPLHGSLGVHALAFPGGAISATIGWYHLSNAGLRSPNYGVNAVMFRIGLTVFPKCGRDAVITSSRPGRRTRPRGRTRGR